MCGHSGARAPEPAQCCRGGDVVLSVARRGEDQFMFSNTNSLVLGKLCGTDRGESRVKAGSGTGQTQPSSSPVGTHSFLRGTVPAPVRLALLGHIPHPARQENLWPHTPPRLYVSAALCPATAAGSSMPAS